MANRKWRIAMWIIVITAVAWTGFLFYGLRPAVASFDLPYRETVSRLQRYYPIPNGNYPLMIKHPAYEGFGAAAWDVRVTYKEIVPGSEFQILIENQGKAIDRKTTVDLQRIGDRNCRIRIDSVTHDSLFRESVSRDATYEHARISELRKFLTNPEAKGPLEDLF